MVDRASSRRFRRRLTAAFVLVAALSAGLLAVLTDVIAGEYRRASFRSNSRDETRLAVALSPRDLDAVSFERFRNLFETVSEARLLVIGDAGQFSSSPDLGISDVPPELVDVQTPTRSVERQVGGEPTLIVGAAGTDGTRHYVFFSLRQLEAGLDELRLIVIVSWLATLAVAAAIGDLVARRTLRPVAETAAVAEQIAAGDLDARLAVADRDEFGTLAASFNNMADEVQSLVRRLEQAAVRERRFTADVAHELRTPLTGMSASASLIADRVEEMPSSLQRPVSILLDDVDRLRELVLELLELSRLDAGTEPPQLEPLRLAESIEAVVNGAEARRSADISIDVGSAIVVADPFRLRRILGNVLDNALTHGSAPVSVTAHRVDQDVEISVVDSGEGIEHAELDRVFDRFTKSDRSQALGGSGLGLAIAREHARSLGGDVTATSAPSGGARLTIRLPASSAWCPSDDATNAVVNAGRRRP